MYEKAIVWIVTHDPKLRARIDERIFPVGEVPELPATAFPFVTYQEIGEVGNTHHQQGTGGLSAAQVRVSVWAEDFSDAAEVRELLRTALIGKRGTFDGETLQGVFLDSREFEPEAPPDAGEHQLQAAGLVLVIWHEETEVEV